MNDQNIPIAVWPFDIAVVGLGIVGSHQITREAQEVIRHCRRTFVIDSGYGVTEYLKTLCPKVSSLTGLYERGKSRLPVYRKMAAEVVVAALNEAPVCLAAYGHPWIYCYPTSLIKWAAPLLNLHVEVFAGVSSFDTLLVDIGTDIAFSGMQMYEATDLLLRRRPLQPDAMCLIWQATIVGDPTYPEKPLDVADFLPLQEYLLKFYPAHHEVTLVMTKTYPLLRSSVQKFPLHHLARELHSAPQVGTLYIPPTHSRPIADVALLERMLAMTPAAGAEERVPARAGRPPIGPTPSER